MATNPKIEVIITATKEKFNREVSEAKTALNSFMKSAQATGRVLQAEGARLDEFNKRFSGLIRVATGALLGVGAAMTAFGVKSVKAAAEMKQVEKGFTTILGSASQAKALLEELKDFAGETPFDLPGVLDGSKRLLAMGFEAKQVIPILTAVGDASAALGLGTEGINRLTLAIGQMSSKGKVSAEEMRQLAEAGIPAWDMLSKKIGVSIPQAMKMAENGAIDAATGVQAILSSMNERYGGLMESQSREVMGIWANLMDEGGRLAVATGDEITEALDLKTRLSNTLTFFTELRESVEKSGLKQTILDQVPAEAFAASAGLIAAAAYMKIIPALANATKAAQTFWATLTLGSGLAVGAVAGVAALTAYKYVDYEKHGISDEKYANMAQIDGGESDSYKDMVETIKQQKAAKESAEKLSALVAKEGLANPWDVKDPLTGASFKNPLDPKNMGQDIFAAKLPETTGKANSAIDNLGLKAGEKLLDSTTKGSSKAANAAKAAADKIKREIDRVNESLTTLAEKSDAASFGFEKMKAANYFDDLEGGAAVIGNIWRETTNEVIKMQEEIQKLNTLQEEAGKLLSRAELAGDSAQIEKAKGQLAEIAQLKIDLEAYAAERTTKIVADSLEEEKELHTRVAATKADLDKAYREGDVEAYIAALNEKSLAEITALEEKQAMMQQYYDWAMEAEETNLMFAMEAAETLKNGLAQGLADAIVNGESLGKVFKNLTKQILSMFIQWQIKRVAASALNKLLATQETATVAAEAATMQAALAPAAWAKLVISPGAGAIATKILMAGMSAAAGAGTLSSAANPLDQGAKQNKLTTDFYDFKFKASGFAEGGFVKGNNPVLSIIGEGRYPEGVFPLDGPIFDRFFGDLFKESSNNEGVTILFNNYGDINNVGDLEDVMEVINNNVYDAKRGG